MIKRMNKKQWYDTLDKYSKLATQRKIVIEEYGIQYWDKEKELTQIQDNLLQKEIYLKMNLIHYTSILYFLQIAIHFYRNMKH